jgi:hypothetical protein
VTDCRAAHVPHHRPRSAGYPLPDPARRHAGRPPIQTILTRTDTVFGIFGDPHGITVSKAVWGKGLNRFIDVTAETARKSTVPQYRVIDDGVEKLIE